MDELEEEKQKPFSSNLAGRIWKIGSLTTSVSANVIANKVKEKISGPQEDENKNAYKQVSEKIVKVLGELKGPWMKIGQYISLNDNVNANDEMFEAFSKLQYESPSMSFYFTKMQIEKELGKSPELIYKDFSRKPIGSASIGQVHEAFLKNGDKVAVKVQYPDMEKIIKSDLTTLKLTLLPFKMFFKKMDPIIEEVETVLMNELDYTQEAYHTELFRKHLSDDPDIIIPEYYPDYTTKRVLTLKFIEGRPLEKAIKEDNLTREEKNNIGHILMRSFMKQLFEIKKIHADPHPGNFLLVERNKIGWLDFGCIKTFDDSFVSGYKKLIRAIITQDPPNIRAGFVEMGFVNEDETEKLDALEEFSNFLALPYINKDDFDLSENIDKLKEGQIRFKKMADKVGFRTPKDFIYLDRTVFGIGMILFKLKVKMNFFKAVEPYLFS